MLILYLDTTTGRWYDANGVELENSSPRLAFQSRERLCIRTVTATSDTMPITGDPNSWPRDTQWSGKLAKITADNDYIHKMRGFLTDSLNAGVISQISANIQGATEAMIPASGAVRLFSSATTFESVQYESRIISGNDVIFSVAGNLNTSYPVEASIDCPQAPFFESNVDIEKSNPSVGEFQFDIVVDSLRLREAMLYTSVASLASQGLELLFYSVGESGNEPVRAFVCKTFAITGTIGDVNYAGKIPETHLTDRAYEILSAIIAEGVDVQLSADGETWIDYPAISIHGSATSWRFRQSATKGEWSPAIPLLAGKNGESAYEVALSNGFHGSISEWLQSLKGPAGKSAYESAVEMGFNGSVEEWLKTLVGPAGAGLDYDVSGASVAEKALYDDKPAGFKFATASVDSKSRVTNLDIWTKLSNSYADWSDAMRVVVFGAVQPEITAVKPIEFTPPPGDGSYYFAIDIAGNPNATIAQVCIDTNDGELVLPYYSDLGVRKILKIDTVLFVYFGNNIPAYNKGRVYLTQMIAAEKSEDGNGGNIVPIEGLMYYGYLPSSENFQSVTDVTTELIESDTIVSENASPVGIVSLGNVPAGSFTIALVPVDSGLTVKKSDGLGGKVSFNVDNGIIGGGANGSVVAIGDGQYKVYGEFNIVGGETTIYIM